MTLYNAEIHTLRSVLPFHGYVTIEEGIIKKVQRGDYSTPKNGDINLLGHHLFPGLIDAHTHLGIIEDTIGDMGDDCNEVSDPFTPQLSPLDGINPNDPCFRDALKVGITTVAVAPGSANVCGGQIIAMKTAGRLVDAMYIGTVGMKFSLGENPKKHHSLTRMGVATLLRENLEQAQLYRRALRRYEETHDPDDKPEYDPKSEALLPVLNRKYKAHFHVHRSDDIMTALRISEEYHLRPVLVHATGGHILADVLGKHNAEVIVGPIIMDRGKPEMHELCLENAALLHAKHCRVAICTDHPEVPIQYLPLSAELCHRGGLHMHQAERSITCYAAGILGLSRSLGAIWIGHEADLAVYAKPPLDAYPEAEMVFIHGQLVYMKS